MSEERLPIDVLDAIVRIVTEVLPDGAREADATYNLKGVSVTISAFRTTPEIETFGGAAR